MTDPVRKLSVVPPPGQPPDKKEGPEDDVHLTLMDHLQELRKRIIYSAYAIVVGFCLVYHYSERLFKWLMQPVYDVVGPTGIHVFEPTEAFFTFMRVAAYGAVVIVSPFIFYQFYRFVAPGLYRKERKMMLPFVIISAICFVGGGIFARYIILPFALKVLIGSYLTNPLINIQATLRMEDTLDFILMVLIAFGAIFELPLILSLLARFGIVSSAFLAKYRRHAIVLNTIIAAVITPTGDAFNLALMAVPLVVFYEFGIIGARMMERQKAGQRVLLTLRDLASLVGIAAALFALFYLITRFMPGVAGK